MLPCAEEMKMHRFIACVVVAFALAAGLGYSVTLQAATPAARFDGQPKFKEGKALGYFIWRDRDT
jgi:hypothetical protein